MKEGNCHPRNGCRRAICRLQKRSLIGGGHLGVLKWRTSGGHLGHLITWESAEIERCWEKLCFSASAVSGQSNDLHAEKEATRLLQVDCGSWTIPRFEAQQIGVSSSDGEIRKEELVMSIILDMYVLNLFGDIPIQRGVLKG